MPTSTVPVSGPVSWSRESGTTYGIRDSCRSPGWVRRSSFMAAFSPIPGSTAQVLGPAAGRGADAVDQVRGGAVAFEARGGQAAAREQLAGEHRPVQRSGFTLIGQGEQAV